MALPQYLAAYGFNGNGPGELWGVRKGDMLVITEQEDRDWWTGYRVLDGPDVSGLVPACYLTPIELHHHPHRTAAPFKTQRPSRAVEEEDQEGEGEGEHQHDHDHSTHHAHDTHEQRHHTAPALSPLKALKGDQALASLLHQAASSAVTTLDNVLQGLIRDGRDCLCIPMRPPNLPLPQPKAPTEGSDKRRPGSEGDEEEEEKERERLPSNLNPKHRAAMELMHRLSAYTLATQGKKGGDTDEAEEERKERRLGPRRVPWELFVRELDRFIDEEANRRVHSQRPALPPRPLPQPLHNATTRDLPPHIAPHLRPPVLLNTMAPPHRNMGMGNTMGGMTKLMGKTSHAAIVRHTLGASFEPTPTTTTRGTRTMEGARSGLLGPSRTMKRGRREEGLVRGRDGGRLQEDPELQGLVHNYWTELCFIFRSYRDKCEVQGPLALGLGTEVFTRLCVDFGVCSNMISRKRALSIHQQMCREANPSLQGVIPLQHQGQPQWLKEDAFPWAMAAAGIQAYAHVPMMEDSEKAEVFFTHLGLKDPRSLRKWVQTQLSQPWGAKDHNNATTRLHMR